tara:strand:- start:11 stop:361 length:351 start_codon:yes stop_codon:yes gene_type:complete
MSKITTNNQPRQIIDFQDLTQKEKEHFDWFKPDELQGGFVRFKGHFDWFKPDELQGGFVRFKGQVYCLDEFIGIHKDGSLSKGGWQGFESQSAFDAIIMKYDKYDSDYVVMGHVMY